MVIRLEESISKLMDDAKTTYQANRYKPGTTEVNPDYIARLSTNEFFFYTKEPLTLKEFEELQNGIAEKAKTLPSGVQLILGSFAVKTDNNKVMNVTPHVTCGQPPDFHFIVKSHTSSIDVRYKEPDVDGDTNTLAVLDKRTAPISLPMPKIMIDGTSRDLTFNNVIPCKTPGGTPFLTTVDICLDHTQGVAKGNYKALVKDQSDILNQPVSHVIVSNCVRISKKQCLGSAVMHVDPKYSPQVYKTSLQHRDNSQRKLTFGNDEFKIYDKVHSIVIKQVMNNYAYKTLESSAGRDHSSYTVSLSTTKFQQMESSEDFKNFKDTYQDYKGDHLKTKILETLQNKIQQTSSKEELDKLKKELKASPEYDVLKTGQSWFTQKTGVKTSSVRALDNMIKQKEKYLEENADIARKLSI
jgi:hypothetical protein